MNPLLVKSPSDRHLRYFTWFLICSKSIQGSLGGSSCTSASEDLKIPSRFAKEDRAPEVIFRLDGVKLSRTASSRSFELSDGSC